MRHLRKLLAVMTLTAAGHAVAAEPVDMELIIAVDVSSSVDENEYRLQMGGIAAAFRNPSVLDAIRSLGPGRLAGIRRLGMRSGEGRHADHTALGFPWSAAAARTSIAGSSD